MKVVKKFVVEELPENRVIEYFGRIGNEIFFVVYHHKLNHDISGWAVSIGPMDNLQDVEVKSIRVPRQGAIIIKTAQGEFVFDKNRRYMKATFGGQPIDIF